MTVVLLVAVTAVAGYRLAAGRSSVAAPVSERLSASRSTSGLADGALPGAATVFDDQYPGVGNLAPDLLAALRAAAKQAAHDGVEVRVNSGWRSPDRQAHLLRDAVATYGSLDEALRWVATAATSSHVAGDAVDVGPAEASTWLAVHGAQHGLCQVYANEPWHFELRPDAVGRGCPPVYADPTQDPRMRG